MRKYIYIFVTIVLGFTAVGVLAQLGGGGFRGPGATLRGPTSSTDNAIVRFNGTTGKVVQDSSGVTIDDNHSLFIDTLNTPMTQTRHTDAATAGSGIAIRKSRGTTLGGNTIVQDNDVIGNLNFMGADGTDFDSAAIIRVEIDGTPSDGTDMPGAMLFLTSPDGSSVGVERIRISSTGDVIIGHDAILAGTVQEFQVSTLTSNGGLALFMNSTNNSESGRILIVKGGAAGRGALTTIVADNEELGDITWAGTDGTDFNLAAQIAVEIDGTPSDGTDMPGAMIFSVTPEASGTPTEIFRLESAGNMILAAPARLHLNQGTDDDGFIDFIATEDADATSALSSFTTQGAVAGHIQILINGTSQWITFRDDPS
ncbi:MAG: hypothetical protein V3S55_06395 [Nitrospiraceae bacterium]